MSIQPNQVIRLSPQQVPTLTGVYPYGYLPYQDIFGIFILLFILIVPLMLFIPLMKSLMKAII